MTPRRLALALAAGLALADASVVTLALPELLRELDTTVEGVAAIIGVYTVVLALALLPAERLMRDLGPRAVGAGGFGLFALASVLCGAAGSLPLLLAFRGLQALGGAAGLVAAFALLAGPGREGAQPSARTLWLGVAVLSTAIGPALGGALTQAFSWQAIFLAQAPFGLAAVAACRGAAEPRPVSGAAREPRSWAAGLALALVSAALTAVLFLLVLLLVAGWGVSPLRAAATVTVLPLAALLGARLGGPARTRAAAGCALVGGGTIALAFLPDARVAWTLVPQALAGVGMGLALPALGGELLPERDAEDAAWLLTLRHVGIALALVVLAPVTAHRLDDATLRARERGVALVLDAKLPPTDKLALAPGLLAGVDAEEPRAGLRATLAAERPRYDAGDPGARRLRRAGRPRGRHARRGRRGVLPGRVPHHGRPRAGRRRGAAARRAPARLGARRARGGRPGRGRDRRGEGARRARARPHPRPLPGARAARQRRPHGLPAGPRARGDRRRRVQARRLARGVRPGARGPRRRPCVHRALRHGPALHGRAPRCTPGLRAPGPLPCAVLPAVPSALAALGWTPDDAAALAALGDPALLPARVRSADRSTFELLGADGPLTAQLAGRLRHDAGPGELPVVGDWVAVEDGPPTVRRVLERRTVLRRAAPTGALQVLAANVDVVLVVSSLNRDLDPRRLEQFVAVAADGGAQPVVVLSKADLLADPSALLAQVRPVTRGTPLVVVSARRGDGLEELAPWLQPGRTAALLGASGVGKSTLVNALLGEERQATAPIKRTSDQGRHTTVRRELITLPSGALLVDAPGLRLPELWNPGPGLAAAFADLDSLAEGCRFSDCAHRSEPGCAVRAAIDAGELDPGRLAGFLELEDQVAGRAQRT